MSLYQPSQTATVDHTDSGELSVLAKLQDLIAESTGNDLEEITPSMLLEEFNPVDFGRIMGKIYTVFHLELNPKEVLAEQETIADLATLIKDELELG
jgi:acyl carrier protein